MVKTMKCDIPIPKDTEFVHKANWEFFNIIGLSLLHTFSYFFFFWPFCKITEIEIKQNCFKCVTVILGYPIGHEIDVSSEQERQGAVVIVAACSLP